MVKIDMPQRKREVRTIDDLTDKQKKFIDILVDNWGSISKTDAYLKAGYETKGNKVDKGSVAAIASKLTNPKINPHICRYLEIRLQQEQEKYEKDKLRRYKIFERLRNGAETKGQYTGAINAEFRAGQLAGQFVDKKEIAHTTLEGMSRDKLEERLKELENKIKDADNIIDVTPEK
jgi:phage terminase small subunit